MQQFSVVFILTLLRLDIRASATGQQEGSSGKTPVPKIVYGSLDGRKKIEGKLYWVPVQAWSPKVAAEVTGRSKVGFTEAAQVT